MNVLHMKLAHNSSKQDSKCLQEQILRERKNEKESRVLTPFPYKLVANLYFKKIIYILPKEQDITDYILLIIILTNIK